MIPVADRRPIHLKIGRLMSRQCSQDDDDILFDTLNHYNQCLDLLLPMERITVARLNVRAGQRARLALATDLSKQFYKIGLELLPEIQGWDEAYEIAFEATQAIAALHNVSGEYEEAEKYHNQ